jgi:hypothetical protein
MLKQEGFGDAPVCRCWIGNPCDVHPGAPSKVPEQPIMRHARQHLVDAKNLRETAAGSATLAASYSLQAQAEKDLTIQAGLLVLSKRFLDESNALSKQASELESTATRVLGA